MPTFIRPPRAGPGGGIPPLPPPVNHFAARCGGRVTRDKGHPPPPAPLPRATRHPQDSGDSPRAASSISGAALLGWGALTHRCPLQVLGDHRAGGPGATLRHPPPTPPHQVLGTHWGDPAGSQAPPALHRVGSLGAPPPASSAGGCGGSPRPSPVVCGRVIQPGLAGANSLAGGIRARLGHWRPQKSAGAAEAATKGFAALSAPARDRSDGGSRPPPSLQGRWEGAPAWGSCGGGIPRVGHGGGPRHQGAPVPRGCRTGVLQPSRPPVPHSNTLHPPLTQSHL